MPFDGFDRDLGVKKPRRTNDLLHHLSRLAELIGPGRCGNADHLRHALQKLLKLQGTVVKRRGQTEAVLHKVGLARLVAVVHRADLRERHVALIHKDDKILREKVRQRIGRRARLPAVKITAVVFDPAAIAHLADHLGVVQHAFANTLRLDQLALLLKLLFLLEHIGVDAGKHLVH